LANAQDESGNYTFAGTKSKTQPFFRDYDGSVTYSGDDYQRKMRISASLEMAMNDPGSKLFMDIPNPFGDYEPEYQLQNASELLLDKAVNEDYFDKSTYRVTFVDMSNGKWGYQLEKDGSVVAADEFNASTGIKYNDLTID